MIKNIIGAAVGSSLSKSSPAASGAAGAAIASAVPFIISRMSIPTMIAVGFGGYYAKRYFDRKKAAEAANNVGHNTSPVAGGMNGASPAQASSMAIPNASGSQSQKPAIFANTTAYGVQ